MVPVRVLEQFKPSLLIEMSGNPDDSKSASFALVEELRRMGTFHIGSTERASEFA